MQAAGRGSRVSDESRALRRALGPLAWCALEILAERAEHGDGLFADASVRSLAAELDVAKNTAHRALVALTRAGLVSAVQHRDDTGRFNAGRYRLHIDHLIPHTFTTPQPPRTSRTPTQRTQHQSPASPTQLSLLNPS